MLSSASLRQREKTVGRNSYRSETEIVQRRSFDLWKQLCIFYHLREIRFRESRISSISVAGNTNRTMDTRVHLPSFPSIHRIGTKHKGSNNNNAIHSTGNIGDNDSPDNNPSAKNTTNVNNNVTNSTISRTVSSANRDSFERPHLRLSEKLRHSATNSGLGGKLSASTTDMGHGHGSINGYLNGSSSGTSIGLIRSPKSRVSSKSSNFSVTVDLPTILPNAGKIGRAHV